MTNINNKLTHLCRNRHLQNKFINTFCEDKSSGGGCGGRQILPVHEEKRRWGLTSLEHEALDDAVEDDAVEVVVLRVRAEVLHRLA